MKLLMLFLAILSLLVLFYYRDGTKNNNTRIAERYCHEIQDEVSKKFIKIYNHIDGSISMEIVENMLAEWSNCKKISVAYKPSFINSKPTAIILEFRIKDKVYWFDFNPNTKLYRSKGIGSSKTKL